VTDAPPSDASRFFCPSCGKPLTATADHLGARVRCPHCDGEFTVTGEHIAGASTSMPAIPRRTFRFTCARCRSVLEARTEDAGQQGACPTCAATFVIPAVDPRTGLATGIADPGEDAQNPTPMHAYAAAGARAPKILRLDDGRCVIVCPRCQAQSPVTADACEACGHPFTADAIAANRPSVGGSSELGVLSAVFGLVGLVVCPILPAVAIVLAFVAADRRRRTGDIPVWTTAMIVGLISGSLSVLLLILLFALR
jgi:DNA-directed RNA polymerase subunit M/transcription elongation factor TFIIS